MPVAKGQAGVHEEMKKFKAGKLHSGSASGPVVKSRKQAIAISMSEAGLARKDNPGSIANRGGSKPHGGFPAPSVGQRRQRQFPPGRTSMYGGPPAAGFSS